MYIILNNKMKTKNKEMVKFKIFRISSKLQIFLSSHGVQKNLEM
jgi:uncharacterized protein YfkK (UPF0435 family)